MLRVLALAGLIATALAADLNFPEAGTPSKALEFEVAVPQGWEVHKEKARLLAIGGEMGFVVTREHMFQDPKDFPDLWQRQLAAAGLGAKVKKTRVGRETAFHAAWKKDGRSIEVYRVYLEKHEMLYNFAFSAPEGAELEPLAKGVLDSFRCTAKEPELVFDTPISDGRLTMKLPRGFQKHEGMLRGPEYALQFQGYATPHQAAYVSILSMDLRTRMMMADGSVVDATDLKGLLESSWNEKAADLVDVDKKPRVKSGYFGGEKGKVLEATGVSKEGIPKSFFGFACKADGYTYVVRILADTRFERLHKSYFKELCSEISFRKE